MVGGGGVVQSERAETLIHMAVEAGPTRLDEGRMCRRATGHIARPGLVLVLVLLVLMLLLLLLRQDRRLRCA